MGLLIDPKTSVILYTWSEGEVTLSEGFRGAANYIQIGHPCHPHSSIWCHWQNFIPLAIVCYQFGLANFNTSEVIKPNLIEWFCSTQLFVPYAFWMNLKTHSHPKHNFTEFNTFQQYFVFYLLKLNHESNSEPWNNASEPQKPEISSISSIFVFSFKTH